MSATSFVTVQTPTEFVGNQNFLVDGRGYNAYIGEIGQAHGTVSYRELVLFSRAW